MLKLLLSPLTKCQAFLSTLSLRTRFWMQTFFIQMPLCVLALIWLFYQYPETSSGTTNEISTVEWYFYLKFVCVFVLMALGIILTDSMRRSVLQTTHTLQNAIELSVKGDISQVLQIKGSDEIARSAQLVETMNQKWSALVALVRSDASVVHQTGLNLSEDTHRLQQRCNDQAQHLRHTTESISDLSLSVAENNESANAVSNLANQLSAIAQSSGHTMENAVNSMKRIQRSANQIADIINIIDGIAFQTNMLALNAAVEAARAGEEGRGFAVVASEVGDLANRSAQSSQEIRQLITDAVVEVKQGGQQIGEVNRTLQDIVSGISQLANNIQSIANATGNQQNHLQQIKQNLSNLDQVTQENRELSVHNYALADDLGNRAEKLKLTVAGFRLRQGTADEAYELVQKAKVLVAEHPKDYLQRITVNSEKLFADRDMYVFAFDRKGQYLAFAGNPEKLNVNLLNVPGLNGQKLVDDAFALPIHGGWVDYQINNPVTGKIEYKTSFIIAVAPDIVIGCGVYKPTLQ